MWKSFWRGVGSVMDLFGLSFAEPEVKLRPGTSKDDAKSLASDWTKVVPKPKFVDVKLPPIDLDDRKAMADLAHRAMSSPHVIDKIIDKQKAIKILTNQKVVKGKQ